VSVRIILAITTYLIHEIWQLDVKVCFDEVIMNFGFVQNFYEACVNKKVNGSSVAYMVLYVDAILLIGNDIEMLNSAKNFE
jgi:hypothetical protein